MQIFDQISAAFREARKKLDKAADDIARVMRAIVNHNIECFGQYAKRLQRGGGVDIADQNLDAWIVVAQGAASRINIAANDETCVVEVLSPDFKRATGLDTDFQQTQWLLFAPGKVSIVVLQIALPFGGGLACVTMKQCAQCGRRLGLDKGQVLDQALEEAAFGERRFSHTQAPDGSGRRRYQQGPSVLERKRRSRLRRHE